MIRKTIVMALATLGLSTAAQAAPLTLEVYNPGENAIFPVSSEIITGEHEAILIDAQFQRNDAEALVARLKASGKTLSTIYISHGDPDYYFGLDVIQAAFPAAKIVATPQTVAHIKASMDGKLAYWGPILKENAPQKLVLPEVLTGDTLKLEDQTIQIKGLKGPSPERSYLWIPSLKTVAGGVVVSSGIHVWVADTQTARSRKDWQATLKAIAALKPAAVVPGHYLGDAPKGLGAVKYTRDYLKSFETNAQQARDANTLIAAMKARYPQAGEAASLELSAKVIKGELKWPQ
ncbi:MBL fold metallo-hydrolase [Uliginosibacterium sp. 31-16]|uniref:MBL fold metallo-hydrolase n=1 Tax=Uliginosibacterium sp. 31-16 TaxID=3068315 RepID=UPI00273D6099|nr:MBL fold metallo-hydrolase [Uliginosibacterium sp. 31-16]MDP5238747.1 MBL fold metallo-hydrolase [Uliginosibacterium sp. 31-16]